jgi:nucleoid-associated protein YejK
MREGISQSTRYRVVIHGRVGRELTDTFEHLELEANGGESSLTGTFADQAQLHGLLDRLQDLSIPIVSVNPVA